MSPKIKIIILELILKENKYYALAAPGVAACAGAIA